MTTKNTNRTLKLSFALVLGIFGSACGGMEGDEQDLDETDEAVVSNTSLANTTSNTAISANNNIAGIFWCLCSRSTQDFCKSAASAAGCIQACSSGGGNYVGEVYGTEAQCKSAGGIIR